MRIHALCLRRKILVDHYRYALRVQILKDAESTVAKITRIPLKTLAQKTGDQSQWEEAKQAADGTHTLLDVLHAKPGSFIAELAEYLLRVEDISCIFARFCYLTL
jgi:hypothetical protein